MVNFIFNKIMFDLINKFSGFISLIVLLITTIGFYWKLRIDIKENKDRICEIEKDRIKKWDTYNREKNIIITKIESINPTILKIEVNLSNINANIEWIKKELNK